MLTRFCIVIYWASVLCAVVSVLFAPFTHGESFMALGLAIPGLLVCYIATGYFLRPPQER